MNLVPKVKAQGVDTYVSPTIPFIPPSGPNPTTKISPTPKLDQPYIILESSFKNVSPGDKFTVQVKIHTQGTPIQGFKFLVKYDPALLSVIDTDQSTAGTQINYLNSFFIPDQHIVEETETRGEIFIIASSAEDTTTISNISVAIIEFEAQNEGFVEVKLEKDDSALVTGNSTDILSLVNSLDFILSEDAINLPTNTPRIYETILPTELTNTALSDHLNTQTTLLIGTILIGAGFVIINHIKHAKIQR